MQLGASWCEAGFILTLNVEGEGGQIILSDTYLMVITVL